MRCEGAAARATPAPLPCARASLLPAFALSAAAPSHCPCFRTGGAASSSHLIASLPVCPPPTQVSALSNAAGVGGGALFVPLFNALLGLPIKGATALSQAVITGGALGEACGRGGREQPLQQQGGMQGQGPCGTAVAAHHPAVARAASSAPALSCTQPHPLSLLQALWPTAWAGATPKHPLPPWWTPGWRWRWRLPCSRAWRRACCSTLRSPTGGQAERGEWWGGRACGVWRAVGSGMPQGA